MIKLQEVNMKEDPSIFTMPGKVEFTADDEKQNILQLTLYDGSVVKHWFWGNIAFELATMKMAKKRNPMLYSHDINQRIAFSDSVSFEEKFVMVGTFLNTTPAQQIKQELKEGFPFEASLKFDPARSKIEHIKNSESVEVNGHTLKGPGSVIKNALILEGSICVFGALKDTNVEAFEAEEEDYIPDPEQPASFWQAVELEMKADTNDRSELQKRADAVRLSVKKYPKLHEKFLEGTRAVEQIKENNPPADFNEALEQRMQADTSEKTEIEKRAAAVRFCVGAYPELHRDFLNKLRNKQ